VSDLPEIWSVILALGTMLDRVGVPWVVGGSVASTLRGVPRQTQDVDAVAALRPVHARALVAAAEPTFLVDFDAVRSALLGERPINLIHEPTFTKVDLFPVTDHPLSEAQIARRQRVEPEVGVAFWVLSPEDVILQKLRWYELGERVSDRQWRDIVGVLSVHRGRLDEAYLDRQASLARLRPVLDLARSQARTGS
jgi:hypothetical protein